MSLAHFEKKIKEVAPKRKEEVVSHYVVGVAETHIKIEKMKNKVVKNDIVKEIALHILRPQSASKPTMKNLLAKFTQNQENPNVNLINQNNESIHSLNMPQFTNLNTSGIKKSKFAPNESRDD